MIRTLCVTWLCTTILRLYHSTQYTHANNISDIHVMLETHHNNISQIHGYHNQAVIRKVDGVRQMLQNQPVRRCLCHIHDMLIL